MNGEMNSAMKVQGKKVKCIYGYKATMNDELTMKIDDIIVLTQCSEDETWLEGTLNGVTGWFPSNYVQLVDSDVNTENGTGKYEQTAVYRDERVNSLSDDCNQSKINETLRIKYINELKRTEESFLDEMCKFVKISLLPLQSTNDIFPLSFVQQLNSSVDELIRCHQMFYQQLREIPDNSDAKIGNLLMNIAGQFKSVYESYAQNNPKFTNIINKKRDQLNKYFESSLNKMISPLLQTSPTSPTSSSSSVAAAIYMTKFLAAPFKQLEQYVKMLREIHRYTEDYHIDRGDLQRCLEFYSTLLVSVHEARKKKEYELDLLASKISSPEAESALKSGECLFISTVLVLVDEELRDRVMLVLPASILFLRHSSSSPVADTFDLDFKISLAPISTHSQLRKVTDLDTVNSQYGGNLLNHPSLVSSYLFELIGFQASGTSCTRFIIACSTQYDLKHSLELISGLIMKLRQQQQQIKPQSVQQGLVRQASSGSASKQHVLSSNLSSPAASHDCRSPTTGQTTPTNGTLSAAANTSLNSSCLSATVIGGNSNRKIFSMRPHPPLIPHFQLPTDSPQATSLDGSLTLKRFMYKKPKLCEPFGKYHGADDDLKMLNVIESLCKTRMRQSVNVNTAVAQQQQQKQDKAAINKINLLSNDSIMSSSYTNGSEKSLSKIVTRLSEEKSRLEESIRGVSNELSDYKKSNRELKSIISSMQKQLENEKQMRRKLETFVRKHLRMPNDGSNGVGGENSTTNGCDLINSILMNIEHESSI